MAKGDVLVRMKADVGNYNANLANARRTLQNFKEENLSLGGIVKNMTRSFTGYAAGLMSIAAVAGKLHETVTEAVALAKAAEGIRNAFSRLNDPNLLKGLREATHGTVADVELMKAAVKFDDFKLPVSELGTMLAFAQQKAKDTGQSVDYMVDSIVTGLGRKSLMILDNLGLSATEVKERMKETGDMTKAVGEIIREQMAKSGDYVETAADRAAQANVSLQNKMEELGRKLAPIEEASSNLWTSMKLGILDVVSGPLTTLIGSLTRVGRMMNAYSKMGGDDAIGRQISALATASNPRAEYFKQMTTYRATNRGLNKAIGAIEAWQGGDHSEDRRAEIEKVKSTYGLVQLNTTPLRAALDANIKAMEEYQKNALSILKPVKADIDTKGAEQNVESLKVKLIELEAQRKKAIAAGDTDLSKELAKQISQVKSDIKGLGGSTTVKHTTIKPEEILPVGSVAELNRQMQELRKEQSLVTNTDEWKQYEEQIRAIGYQIKSIKGDLSAGGLAIASGVSITGGMEKPSFDQKGIANNVDKGIKNLKTSGGKDLAKQGEQARQAWSLAAQAVSSVGDAFNSIEDPGVKAMGTITQAIASIALGFAQASVTAASLGPFGWIAFLAAGAAALATTIGTVHSLTNLSEGGFITGKSYSGDNIKANGGYVGLNAGELVLNTSQQNNLANAIMNNRENYADFQPYVSGEMVYLAMRRAVKRKGYGEIVTTKSS